MIADEAQTRQWHENPPATPDERRFLREDLTVVAPGEHEADVRRMVAKFVDGQDGDMGAGSEAAVAARGGVNDEREESTGDFRINKERVASAGCTIPGHGFALGAELGEGFAERDPMRCDTLGERPVGGRCSDPLLVLPRKHRHELAGRPRPSVRSPGVHPDGTAVDGMGLTSYTWRPCRSRNGTRAVSE